MQTFSIEHLAQISSEKLQPSLSFRLNSPVMKITGYCQKRDINTNLFQETKTITFAGCVAPYHVLRLDAPKHIQSQGLVIRTNQDIVKQESEER
jgi:hypothetical protein